MRNKNIDNLIEKLLSEEFNKKSQLMVEKLHGKQSKLDVAKPKGKLDAADFKMLGSMKKKETNEESEVCNECGGYMQEGECMECGMKYETELDEYGSNSLRDEPGWSEEDWLEKLREKGVEDDAEKKSKKEPTYVGRGLEDNKQKAGLFNKLKKMIGLSKDEMEESEFEEGSCSLQNALRKTKKGEKFKLGGKTYTDNSNLDEGKKQGWKGKNKTKVDESTFRFTESEIVEIIEKLVNEEKDNIKSKKVSGLEKVNKSNKQTKTETDKYMKDLEEKMKGYLKNASDSKYEMNPTKFPEGNGQRKKKDTKAYHPSDAVEEYIESFSYPGQTNLVFNEIKPNDDKIKMYLKGDSKTGNAEVDEDGKPLGNVVPSEVGEKFFKNYEDNDYGDEQMNASYKRYPQPVDSAGEQRESGNLKSKKIFKKLGESEEKKEKLINEQRKRIFDLLKYNKKTQ